jgi:short-subunit dehydrogenase
MSGSADGRMDVTELEEASRTLEAVIGQLGDVELIILNAGVGHLNPDWTGNCKRKSRTNVLGFTALACVASKYVEQRGVGRLVGISSISALRGSRHATSYAASKAYIIREGLGSLWRILEGAGGNIAGPVVVRTRKTDL